MNPLRRNWFTDGAIFAILAVTAGVVSRGSWVYFPPILGFSIVLLMMGLFASDLRLKQSKTPLDAIGPQSLRIVYITGGMSVTVLSWLFIPGNDWMLVIPGGLIFVPWLAYMGLWAYDVTKRTPRSG